MAMTEIQMLMELNTWNTPTIPDAVRGSVVDPPVTETREQLDSGLIWWCCSFCGRMVMINCSIRGRERCSCGAVRCHYCGQEGWRKDGKTWWIC